MLVNMRCDLYVCVRGPSVRTERDLTLVHNSQIKSSLKLSSFSARPLENKASNPFSVQRSSSPVPSLPTPKSNVSANSKPSTPRPSTPASQDRKSSVTRESSQSDVNSSAGKAVVSKAPAPTSLESSRNVSTPLESLVKPPVDTISIASTKSVGGVSAAPTTVSLDTVFTCRRL